MPVSPPPAAFEKRQVVRVNPLTGYSDGAKGSVSIADVFVGLPPQRVQGLDIDITTERPAQAVIYGLESDFDSNFSRSLPVVVFLHGFSQRPRNYESTLRLLAAQGYLVIAPRTWLFDVAFPWTRIEGAARPGQCVWCVSSAAKLQSALLVDALRCVSWAKDNLPNAPGAVSLLGHSMGGAIALVAARALGSTKVASVATLAPAVVGTAVTEINPLLSWDDGDVAEFVSSYGATRTFIASGKGDRVVKFSDTQRLFDFFRWNRAAGDTEGLCEIVPGSHIGFEDSLRVDVGFLKVLDTLLFKLIDVLVFRILEGVLDTDDQLELTKQLLLVWLSQAGNTGTDSMEKEMKGAAEGSDATLTWSR